MTDQQVTELSLLQPAVENRDLVRGDAHLASRTVENLFWFGRYTERCDNTARLMRRCFDSLIDLAPQYRGGEWPTLIALCQWQGLLPLDTIEDAGSTVSPAVPSTGTSASPTSVLPDDAAVESRLLQAMHDPELPGLAYQVKQLFRVGFNVRERLSTDNWRSLNQMLQTLAEPNKAMTLSDALALLDQAAVSSMTLSGFALDGMTRDMGWRFLSMGRRIERLQFMCSVIQHALAMPANSGLEWLLELGDSIITYRARYVARPEWLAALDLLLLDESNPRAVAVPAGRTARLPRQGLKGSWPLWAGYARTPARATACIKSGARFAPRQRDPAGTDAQSLLRQLSALGAAGRPLFQLRRPD